MNQNDMDRYLWRTGQRWSGDDVPFRMPGSGRKLARGTILLLWVGFLLTGIILLLLR